MATLMSIRLYQLIYLINSQNSTSVSGVIIQLYETVTVRYHCSVATLPFDKYNTLYVTVRRMPPPFINGIYFNIVIGSIWSAATVVLFARQTHRRRRPHGAYRSEPLCQQTIQPCRQESLQSFSMRPV